MIRNMYPYRVTTRPGDVAGLNAAQKARATGQWRVRVEVEGHSAVLRWSYLGPQAPPDREECRWVIERSGSPAGPFYALPYTVPYSARLFRDDSIPALSSPARYLYYRIRLFGEEVDELYGYNRPWDWAEGVFGLTWQAHGYYENEAPGEVREARKRHYLLMSKRSAEVALIYRDRWDFPFDSQQVDPVTGMIRPGVSNATPYNTSREGGFYAPIEVLISASPTPTGHRDRPVADVSASMLHWPAPCINDRIRTHDNSVYEVAEVIPHMMYGFPTHYDVQLVAVTDTDPLTKLPMPEGRDRVARFPRRQFSRSANIESYRQSMDHGALGAASHTLPEPGDSDG